MKNVMYSVASVILLALIFVGLSAFTTPQSTVLTGNAVHIYGVGATSIGMAIAPEMWFTSKEKAIDFAKNEAITNIGAPYPGMVAINIYGISEAYVSDTKVATMKSRGQLQE